MVGKDNVNVAVAIITGDTLKEDNLENMGGIPGGRCLHYFIILFELRASLIRDKKQVSKACLD